MSNSHQSKNTLNRTAAMLSRISAEVDDYIYRRPHPLDNVFSHKDLSSEHITGGKCYNENTYVNIRSYDENYAEYANGYPSDAEDDVECFYDDGSDNDDY